MKRALGVLASVILAVLSGCASAGINYQYQNIPKLKINEFKIEDVDTVFGKPFKTEKKSSKVGNIDIYRFEYAFADIGTARGRVLILEFKNGVLNSYISNSSFDEDRTLFNEGKIDQVKIGVSTHADTVNIFGEPHGKANCPSTLDDYKKRCENASTVWAWMYQGKIVTMVKKNLGSSNAFLSFDANGKASNIEFGNSK
ncbi:MAG: hypothetical protein WC539_07765 [Nitrospirota bacterium]